MKISIMQPYFFPYLNYFKLIEMSDIFIVLNDVQFQRRGWVHRNKFVNRHNKNYNDWLTLPLKKCKISTNINNLCFDEKKIKNFVDKSKKFDFFYNKINAYPEIKKNIFKFELKPSEYLFKNIKIMNKILKIKTKLILSSDINVSNKINYEERIIKMVQFFKGDTYFNLPGGKKLYDKNIFKKNGIDLIFLENQKEKKISILDTLD